MSKRIAAGLAALLLSAAVASAQSGQVLPVPLSPPAPVASCNPLCCDAQNPCCPSRFWGGVDYLLWWERAQPVNVPLVTSFTNPANIGALGAPDTRILVGGSAGGFNYGDFSGIRATLGGWYDCDRTIGAEVSGFILSTRSANFAASADGVSSQLAIPFFATQAFPFNSTGETSLNAGIAIPPGIPTPTTVTVSTSSRLWGFDANNVFRLNCDWCRPLSFLFGFRYVQLDESLNLNATFLDTYTSPGNTVSATDSFRTLNQFYGAQVGVRAEKSWERFSVSGAVKCAFGVNHELLDIGGSTTVNNGAFGFPTGTYPGAVFSEPSNIGSHPRNDFAVVPEGQLNVGYNFGSHVRVQVGYDFLYMSDVLRPGAQIDRNINPTQNALFAFTNGVLAGPAAPPPVGLTHPTDFWAQGVNFGILFRF